MVFYSLFNLVNILEYTISQLENVKQYRKNSKYFLPNFERRGIDSTRVLKKIFREVGPDVGPTMKRARLSKLRRATDVMQNNSLPNNKLKISTFRIISKA